MRVDDQGQEGSSSSSALEWRAFFERNFCQRDQRRKILLHWLRLKWTDNVAERAAHAFERLLRTFLFEPVDFHLRSDSLLIFGDRYPVRLEWLSAEDRVYCRRLFEMRDAAFFQCKEYPNGQIDYSAPRASLTFDELWRQQLVRDFVHIVYGLRHDGVILELIAAVQWILLDKRSRFIRDILCGLNGHTDVSELMCIE